jgi:carbonic anhydrase
LYTSAVLAVLFNVDADPTDNPFFAQIIDSVTSTLYQSVSSFSLSGVLSQTTVFAPYYYYQGSMTVPNCTDMFSWYVLATPQRISTKQLAAFSKKWSLNDTFAGGRGNNRATQELNSRTLYFNSGASNQAS